MLPLPSLADVPNHSQTRPLTDALADILQWIPPIERARAVSLTTSGMYLGSAISMLILPSLAAAWGPASLLTVVGCLGLAWLGLWLAVGREAPHM